MTRLAIDLHVWLLWLEGTLVLKCGGFGFCFFVDSYRFMFVLIGWSI